MTAETRERLSDTTELLFRQIRTSWWLEAGRITSQNFKPLPKDHGLLSTSRSSLTSAEASYRLHTEAYRLESVGVMAVTVEECNTLDLSSFWTPKDKPFPDPAHSEIDFGGKTRNQMESCAKVLAEKARSRGWKHGPVESQRGPWREPRS